MRVLVLVIVLMICKTIAILAQSALPSDHYEWHIYFTDVKNNSDSIVFGTNALAKQNELNSIIGENIATLSDTNSLIFVINKSEKLKTKKAFAPIYTNKDNLIFGYFMDTLFYFNQKQPNWEYNAPVFISGRTLNFPLKVRIRFVYYDSLWFQRLILWKLFLGNFEQTYPYSEHHLDIEYDSFSKIHDSTFVVQKSDLILQPDGAIRMYFLFNTVVTAYKDIDTKIELFPNPAKDIISILQPVDKTFYSYTIFDIMGKEIKSGSIDSSNINVTLLPNGTYILALKTKDNKIGTRKFVISR